MRDRTSTRPDSNEAFPNTSGGDQESGLDRQALALVSDAVLAAAGDGRILFVNPAFEALRGRTSGDLVGRSLEEVGAYDPEFLAQALSALRQGQVFSAGRTAFRPGGEPFQEVVTATPFLDPDGNLDHFILVGRDATESRLSIQALKASEERFRALVENSTDWEYWMAPDKSLVYVSPSSLAVTGYRAEEFMADPALLTRILDPRDQPLLARHQEHLASLPEEASLDFRIVTREGETRWVSHACRAIRDARGHFLGRRVSNRDITARKRMETELAESKDLLDALINFNPAFITVKDTQGRYILANPGFSRNVGFAPDEIVGRTSREILPASMVEAALAEDRQVIERGAPLTLEKTVPSGGQERDFLITKFPLGGKDGSVRGVGLIATDITERKKVERELTQTLRTQRFILDHSPVGISFVRDRVIQWCNPGFAQLFGARPEDLAGQPTRLLYPDQESYEEFGRTQYPVLARGEKASAVRPMRRLDGVLFTDRLVGQVLDPANPQGGSIWIMEDITEQKRAERLAALNERRSRALLDLSRLTLARGEDIMAFALEHAVDLTESEVGYLHLIQGRDTILLTRWSKSVGPQCTESTGMHYPLDTAGIWADSVRTGQPVIHNDYPNETGRKGLPEGHLPVLRHLSVPVLAEGEIKAVAGVGNRKEPYDEVDAQQLQLYMNGMWALLARRQAEEALRDSEARFRVIAESAKDAIIMTDDLGRVEYWNPAAEDIFGYRREDFGDQDVHAVIARPQDRDAFQRMRAHFQATGQGGALGARREFTGRHKSGRLIPIELTLSSIQVAGKWHAIAIIRDIGERKRAEAMREDLERIARHDLKAPLNALINLPDLIAMEGGLSSTQTDYLNLLKESGYRMLSMIDSSLNLLKLEQGTYALAKSPVELVALARKIGLEFRDLAARRRIVLAVLLDGAEPVPGAGLVVPGEEMLLHSMLANLIKNALEACPDGAQVSVELSADRDGGDRASIAVRNPGEVPQDMRARFFEKYATSGKARGTGLGTYSARLIAEVHGGSISMESSPEEGTCVRVVLPGPARRLP
jgi:PAS domain S-box-containing protein